MIMLIKDKDTSLLNFKIDYKMDAILSLGKNNKFWNTQKKAIFISVLLQALLFNKLSKYL